MEKTSLTGIERDLVLNYLIDGNVPLTVIFPDENPSTRNPEIFQATISSQSLKILKQGIILLDASFFGDENFSKNFVEKKVRVQFYFNKLGLFFDSVLKPVSYGLALVIPSEILRIEDTKPSDNGGLHLKIYYSPVDENQNFDCFPENDYNPAVAPKWSEISEEKSLEAKTLLEKIVKENIKSGSRMKNGAYLISVSRFLTEAEQSESAVSNAEKLISPNVLFVDHEKIVLAFRDESFLLKKGNEYAVKIFFPSGLSGPLKFREIFVTGAVDAIYEKENTKIACAVLRFTSIKNEDTRFLYEKTKNELVE